MDTVLDLGNNFPGTGRLPNTFKDKMHSGGEEISVKLGESEQGSKLCLCECATTAKANSNLPIGQTCRP